MSNKLPKRPLLEEFYFRFLRTEDSAGFIEGVASYYNLQSLVTLAQSGSRMSRRAAVLAIGYLGSFSQNDTLGKALNDSDRGVRMLADHGIRQLWLRIGNSGLETGLRRVIRLNRLHRFASAIDLADELIAIAPGFAESWNQRAIAACQLDDYQQAIRDCQKTIELNPWHFLAALGAANCNLELDRIQPALEGYRLALAINPDLDTVRSQIDYLARIAEDRS